MLYLYIRINIIKLPEPVKYPFDPINRLCC